MKLFCINSQRLKLNVQLKQPSRGVLKNRCSENKQEFTGEHPCRNVISIKLRY